MRPFGESSTNALGDPGFDRAEKAFEISTWAKVGERTAAPLSLVALVR
jgi:hypothetical protein